MIDISVVEETTILHLLSWIITLKLFYRPSDDFHESFINILNHWEQQSHNLCLKIMSHRNYGEIGNMMASRRVPLREMYDLVAEYDATLPVKVEPLLSKHQFGKK